MKKQGAMQGDIVSSNDRRNTKRGAPLWQFYSLLEEQDDTLLFFPICSILDGNMFRLGRRCRRHLRYGDWALLFAQSRRAKP
jgi:hypothetical protein